MPGRKYCMYVLFLLPVHVSAQGIAGAWNTSLDTTSGIVDLRLDLDVDEDILRGVVTAGSESLANILYISNGIVDGNELAFDLTFELGIQGNRPIPTIRYQGNVTGNRMTLLGLSDNISLDGDARQWRALVLTRPE